MPRAPRLSFQPLTRARWPDLERLFGPRGACGGCWCMYWRRRRSVFDRQKGAGNKRAFKRIVSAGEVPGLLAYSGQEPVAWCALGPRDGYPVLDNSRVLARLDSKPVWSVTCFFVAKGWRQRGVTTKLLRAAVEFARRRGARIVEGYPVEPKKGRMADVFVYTGLPGTFTRAGFREVARRSPTRPFLRRYLRSR